MFAKFLATAFTAAAIVTAALNPASAAYVQAYDSDIYWEWFVADVTAEICIEGDGRSDIDLWVYDENGNLIDKSTSYDAYECVSFTPIWDGEFQVVVENGGKPSGSRYEMYIWA